MFVMLKKWSWLWNLSSDGSLCCGRCIFSAQGQLVDCGCESMCTTSGFWLVGLFFDFSFYITQCTTEKCSSNIDNNWEIIVQNLIKMVGNEEKTRPLQVWIICPCLFHYGEVFFWVFSAEGLLVPAVPKFWVIAWILSAFRVPDWRKNRTPIDKEMRPLRDR